MRIRDELSRLSGISEVLVFGQRNYSMRIWLDPDKLASRNLEVTDVVNAIREQNMHAAPGRLVSRLRSTARSSRCRCRCAAD